MPVEHGAGSRQASVQVFSLLRAILVSGLGKHLNFDLDFPVCRNVEKSTSFDLRKKKSTSTGEPGAEYCMQGIQSVNFVLSFCSPKRFS